MLQGLDYTKFRLFHLSILWRASLAKRARPFIGLKLPGPHEKALREMFWADAADLYDGYHITGTCLTVDGEVFHAVADAQQLATYRGAPTYGLMYAGCVWTFYVGTAIPPGALARDGSIRLTVSTIRDYFHVPGGKKSGR